MTRLRHFPILQALGLTVTEDEDSYNIDFNGDWYRRRDCPETVGARS